jgi:hypothetical protein
MPLCLIQESTKLQDHRIKETYIFGHAKILALPSRTHEKPRSI